jgi:hypothetical protein
MISHMSIPEQPGPEPESLAEFTVKERKTPVIDWYRTPIPTAEFKALHKKSDLKGAVQTLGYLGILAATGCAAFYSFRHWPWLATAALVFVHGMVTAFLINGVHEMGHGTVFQTNRLNRLFCHILAFLGWINHETFHASHTRHHRYTLHPPDDLEVVLPLRLMVRHFLLTGFIDPVAAWKAQGSGALGTHYPVRSRTDRGGITGKRPVDHSGAGHARAVLWRLAVFPMQQHAAHRAAGSCAGLPSVLPHLRPPSGDALPLLADELSHRASHVCGGALLQSWQTPCADPPRSPPCPDGLVAVRTEIAAIQALQEKDPSYQHQPQLQHPAR